jgi:hypothetical protein
VLLDFGIERVAGAGAFLVDLKISQYRDIKNYSLWLLFADCVHLAQSDIAQKVERSCMHFVANLHGAGRCRS